MVFWTSDATSWGHQKEQNLEGFLGSCQNDSGISVMLVLFLDVVVLWSTVLVTTVVGWTLEIRPLFA